MLNLGNWWSRFLWKQCSNGEKNSCFFDRRPQSLILWINCFHWGLISSWKLSSANNLSEGKLQDLMLEANPANVSRWSLGSKQAHHSPLRPSLNYRPVKIPSQIRPWYRLFCVWGVSNETKVNWQLFQVSGWQRPQPNLPLRHPRRRKNQR